MHATPPKVESAFFPEAAPGDASDLQRDNERIRRLEERIRGKIQAYVEYDFTEIESRALNIFFDLAQEFDDISDLLALCVIIPKVFFDKRAALFLLNRENALELQCCAVSYDPSAPVLVKEPTLKGGRFHVPIKGNKELTAQLPFRPWGDVIGILDIQPMHDPSPHERLFFEKYANRIGFQIHNRIISKTNKEHLHFINNLVEDIGHNVIVPNMYFKLYYRRLESKIRVLRDISNRFSEFTHDCSMDGEQGGECRKLQREMEYTFEALMDQYREIYRHYEQTSLFLETLLRRSHFEEGRYVVEMRSCNLYEKIIEPQVDRYRPRLQDRGIELAEEPGGCPLKDTQIMVDVGLISQVFANFLSNAVKYTQASPEDSGAADGRRRLVRYFVEIVPDFFGPGREGVKVAVFSTGPHLSEDERARLFTEGFRGSNAQAEYGTGHGLSFVKEVVGLHGGKVGYEPRPGGNEFYFVLPRNLEDGNTGLEP